MTDDPTRFDPVEHLDDLHSVVELLAQARATGDQAVIARAVQIAARACELHGFSLADMEAVSDNPEWSQADLAVRGQPNSAEHSNYLIEFP